MKESITKFDLEAAFKALDEIDSPTTTRGLKANKPALTEIFSRKSKFDALFEDYYDVGNPAELSDAKADREAEVAKAKLARIEKIVDLDADSPEDLLTSYVGKLIIQCPQCMTLFYKKPEDIEESEDDETTVNIGEVCQHCGNESGYTLIGKVGEASASEEASTETEAPAEETAEVASEEPAEATGEDEDLDLDIDLEDTNEDDIEFDLDSIVDDEEETKEESFYQPYGNYLTENLNEAKGLDLEISDTEFKDLINSPEFKKPISDAEVRGMLASFKEGLSDDTKEENDNATQLVTEGKIGDFFRARAEAKEAKSRADKANWILQYALKPGAQPNDDGTIPEDRLRFKTFVILGFTNKYSSGKLITKCPGLDCNGLVFGMSKPEVAKDFINAEKLAISWSAQDDHGPACIYLAQDATDEQAVVICQYYKGKLVPINDKLEAYHKQVTKELEGMKLAKSAHDAERKSLAKNAKKVPVKNVKVGDVIVAEKELAKVLKVTPDDRTGITFEIEFLDDGEKRTLTVPSSSTVEITEAPAGTKGKHDK